VGSALGPSLAPPLLVETPLSSDFLSALVDIPFLSQTCYILCLLVLPPVSHLTVTPELASALLA
jgi:hypothetical protein